MVRYAYNEGFGIVYERLIRDRFFQRILDTYKLESVLEFPADGTSGFPGINSTFISQQGCSVTVANSDPAILSYARIIWEAMELPVKIVKVKHETETGLQSDSFDLVWNYCEIERSRDSIGLLKEMVRLSRRLIMLMTQNSLTYGYPIHKLYHYIKKKRWDHGDPELMRIENLLQLVKDQGLRVVESGMIDAPPAPDLWELMLLPFRKQLGFEKRFPFADSKEIAFAASQLRREKKTPYMVEAFRLFEEHLPVAIKPTFAHHYYVLALNNG